MRNGGVYLVKVLSHFRIVPTVHDQQLRVGWRTLLPRTRDYYDTGLKLDDRDGLYNIMHYGPQHYTSILHPIIEDRSRPGPSARALVYVAFVGGFCEAI